MDRAYQESSGSSPHDVVANMLDCDIIVNKFKLHSCYYVHFQANTLGKGMNILILPSYVLNSTTTVFLQEWLWH